MQSGANKQLSLFASPATQVSSSNETLKVGQIFTPVSWAAWLLSNSGVLSGDWTSKKFLDPTGGDGAFLIALGRECEKTYGIDKLRGFANQLFYIEIDEELAGVFRRRFFSAFGVEFPNSNIANIDFLLQPFPFEKVDVVVGNPPWVNFTGLPANYKEPLKEVFNKYGLNPDRRRLLLGSSRVDLSALVIVKAFVDSMKDSGEFCFFAPLSLFLGDSAHDGFRAYKSLGKSFRISNIWDFNGKDIFGGVATRYCAFGGTVGLQASFPLPYHILENDKWNQHAAFPLKESYSQLRIYNSAEECEDNNGCSILRLSPSQKPRQGVNTCGTNDVFIFDDTPEELPPEFIYPLVGKRKKGAPSPHRFILIPHATDGKPLPECELRNYPKLWEYLACHKEILCHRKGVLIQNWIGKGYWWALLGVGPYSFAPYKVLWKSLGAKTFEPEILSGLQGQPWQGNQALHAFVPAWCFKEAQEVRKKLLSPRIAECLASLRMEGSRNWAQPGKISKLITFEEEGTFIS